MMCMFSARNDKNPRMVFKHSHAKFWWRCGVCLHEWQAKANSVANGTGCPFPGCCPAPKQLCDSETCETCLAASIAGDERLAVLFSSRNGANPRTVLKHSGAKYWWHCGVCLHEWQAMTSNVAYGKGCPFPGCCPTPQQLCDSETCETCLAASIAGDDRMVALFSSRNGANPRTVLKKSGAKLSLIHI